MPAVKSTDPEQTDVPVLSEDEQKALLAAEIEKAEKLAGSQLHMAEWFLAEGKTEIAKRRLQQLVETLPESGAAKQAKRLLKKL